MRGANGTWRVLGYFAALLVIANFVTPLGALAQIPIQYYLKDRLQLTAQQSALFSLLMFVPVYFAFLFGMVRDRWSPFGRRDQGFFLLFAPIAAAVYVLLAFVHQTSAQLFTGALTIMLVYRLIGPAVAGMSATVGQALRITGRLSVLVQFVGNVIGAGISFLAGWVQIHVSPQNVFLFLAAASIGLFLLNTWRPREIERAYDDTPAKHSLVQDIGRLVRHRPLYPAILIWLTWSFGPSQGTPLFYHLTNTVKLNPEQFGLFNSLQALAFIPGIAVYGFLCHRVALMRLLIWATVFAIPQMLALNFIDSAGSAYAATIFIGAVGGMAFSAYYDLVLRSCPKGFEGTGVELAITAGVVIDRFGNLFGSYVYSQSKLHGFVICNWITAAAYALILPMLLMIPRETVAAPDAEIGPVDTALEPIPSEA